MDLLNLGFNFFVFFSALQFFRNYETETFKTLSQKSSIGISTHNVKDAFLTVLIHFLLKIQDKIPV